MHEPKSYSAEIPIYGFHTPKKFIKSHLLRPVSGSGFKKKGPDPTGSEFATLFESVSVQQQFFKVPCPRHQSFCGNNYNAY
jgi:hypothetical protein